MGPYSREEVTKLLGRVWVVARRFGIRQGAKTRSIDDFSEFLINSAFGCFEKVDCAGIDDICLVIRCLMETLSGGDDLVLEAMERVFEADATPFGKQESIDRSLSYC